MTERPLRILLVGHGRMGRMVEALAPELNFEIAAALRSADAAALANGRPEWHDVAAAIDFSTGPAFAANLPKLAALKLNVVVGTTGWQAQEPQLRHAVAEAGIGLVAAPNFSLGVNLFEAIIEHATRLFANQPAYGAWLHEAHHSAKRDAPSGTALLLKAAMERAGYNRPIDIASTRAGAIPGTHTIGFDGPGEAVVLSHTARDRTIFARGALEAARWVQGRQGWFTMRDVLGLT